MSELRDIRKYSKIYDVNKNHTFCTTFNKNLHENHFGRTFFLNAEIIITTLN